VIDALFLLFLHFFIPFIFLLGETAVVTTLRILLDMVKRGVVVIKVDEEDNGEGREADFEIDDLDGPPANKRRKSGKFTLIN
jgi:hypothetical protein